MNGARLNHHLSLRDGMWWTRIERHGNVERKSTGCPKSQVGAARPIRDRRLEEAAIRREGIDIPCRQITLGEVVALYLKEESQPYDRERGGEQPGTKRSARTDRSTVQRIFRHISPNLSCAGVDGEFLLDLAEKIEREVPTPAPSTRRKVFALLRRVFAWAKARQRVRQTGVTRSPFADLDRSDRMRLFPKTPKRGYLYTPEQLRAIYAALPRHLVPFVRFAVHTGMRFSEIVTLTWENVNVEAGIAHIEARFAKNKHARNVALGDVAASILRGLSVRRMSGPVFLGRRGKPIRNVRTGFEAAVVSVWKASNPEEQRPRFHDLRKTAATAVEAVSSHAVAKRFLGHSDEAVTDSYLIPSLDAVREAINRAARLIDGEPSLQPSQSGSEAVS